MRLIKQLMWTFQIRLCFPVLQAVTVLIKRSLIIVLHCWQRNFVKDGRITLGNLWWSLVGEEYQMDHANCVKLKEQDKIMTIPSRSGDGGICCFSTGSAKSHAVSYFERVDSSFCLSAGHSDTKCNNVMRLLAMHSLHEARIDRARPKRASRWSDFVGLTVSR